MKVVERVNEVFTDKRFLRKTVAIALPIALQGLLNTSLNLVDTLMIGTLGDSTIASVGLANKVFFVFSLLLFGIMSGSGILIAQYWGKRDIVNIRRVLGMSLLLGVGASFIFVIAGALAPDSVMRIFTPDKSTIGIGASYLAVVAFSYPLTAITNSYITVMRGVNEVKAPIVITLISICINVLLNYSFIFGNFGMPRLGVVGAALATLIARIVECICILLIVYIRKGPAAATPKECIHFTKSFCNKYISVVKYVIINEFMWGLGVTMYSLVYGRMGNAAVAAITITQTVEQILLVVFQGLSAATAVILGNEMGANQLKRADQYAKNFVVLQFILAVLMMIVCYFIRTPMIELYNITDEVANYIQLCLLVFILYMPFKMFNYVNIVGILRSGGDSGFALFLDFVGVWFIGVPMAVLGGLVFNLPIYLVYGMVMSEEIFKMCLGFWRYKQKKWLRNIVATEGF